MRSPLGFLGGIVAAAAAGRDIAAAQDHGRRESIITTIDATSLWVDTASGY
jgi:hypothetical protein